MIVARFVTGVGTGTHGFFKAIFTLPFGIYISRVGGRRTCRVIVWNVDLAPGLGRVFVCMWKETQRLGDHCLEL